MNLSFGYGYDRYHALVTSSFVELHYAINQSIECVIFTDAHVSARIVLGATLTHDDVASYYIFTAEFFHAESLRSRLTAVLRTTYTFFMCHFYVLLLSDY